MFSRFSFLVPNSCSQSLDWECFVKGFTFCIFKSEYLNLHFQEKHKKQHIQIE